MPITQNITTVLFDIGGTLLHSRSKPYEQIATIAKKYGYEFDPLQIRIHMNVFQEAREQANKEYPDNYNMMLLLSYSALCRKIGINEKHIRGIVRNIQKQSSIPQSWIAYSETHEILQSLLASGFELGVVSNWDANLPEVLKALELDEYFSSVVASQAVGIAKPEIEIFEIALEAMDKSAQECVYVGNDIAMDTSCVLLGMESIIIDRHDVINTAELELLNNEYDELGSSAHIRIVKNLVEVEKEISKQNAMTMLFWNKMNDEYDDDNYEDDNYW